MGEEGAGPERSQAPPPEDLKDFPPPPTGAGQDYDTRRLGGGSWEPPGAWFAGVAWERGGLVHPLYHVWAGPTGI